MVEYLRAPRFSTDSTLKCSVVQGAWRLLCLQCPVRRQRTCAAQHSAHSRCRSAGTLLRTSTATVPSRATDSLTTPVTKVQSVTYYRSGGSFIRVYRRGIFRKGSDHKISILQHFSFAFMTHIKDKPIFFSETIWGGERITVRRKISYPSIARKITAIILVRITDVTAHSAHMRSDIDHETVLSTPQNFGITFPPHTFFSSKIGYIGYAQKS